MSSRSAMRFFAPLLWTIAFAVAYTQLPLYSVNQHTKFLHGLAAAGYGLLREDWLANTADPLPVFSWLVAFTYRYLGESFFYLYYVALLGVYLHALVGIAEIEFGIDGDGGKRLAFTALLFVLHSHVIGAASLELTGVNFPWHLHSGVADQYLLGPIFQTCNFGVFLLESVHQFLRRRDRLAVLCLGVAATFHSTYLVAAGVLALCYLWLRLRQGSSPGRVVGLALLSLLSVAPVLIHSFLFLSPTAPELWEKARDIIVNFRIPQHTDPRIWLNSAAALKIAVLCAAVALSRGTDVGRILLGSFGIATLATLYRVAANDATVAFISPWRLSAFLVPLASAVILARAIEALWRYVDTPPRARLIRVVGAAAIVFCVAGGAIAERNLFADDLKDDAAAMMKFVATSKRPGDLYLIPVEMEQFRLSTGAPILVSFKTHPYRDVEVMEWYERVQLARRVYSPDEASPCELLRSLAARYRITHVVATDRRFETCGVGKVYEDARYLVYRIAAPSRQPE